MSFSLTVAQMRHAVYERACQKRGHRQWTEQELWALMLHEILAADLYVTEPRRTRVELKIKFSERDRVEVQGLLRALQRQYGDSWWRVFSDIALVMLRVATEGCDIAFVDRPIPILRPIPPEMRHSIPWMGQPLWSFDYGPSAETDDHHLWCLLDDLPPVL